MTAPLADVHLREALAARYSLVREIGAGGMATVYLAHDLRHDRKVALKVLRPELAAVIGADRFLIEIRTTANLQHPHILPLFDSGQVHGTVFYVMPFVEGESLRDRLTREKQLPVTESVRIATEVASALSYAHRQGVIHRDIKPENILLHDGQAQVADFGIALAASSAGATRLTETGMSLGTPQYMSPEQAMGERTLDARTDIYALACALYEMLIGEPPFTGPTAQAIVARVITTRPTPPADQRQTVPPHVSDAIMTALEKLPADRFATAAAFATALATPGPSTARTAAARAPAPRGPLAIAAALGAALGAIGLWGLMPAPEPETRPVVRFEIIGDSAHPLELNCCGQLFAIAPDERTIVFQSRERGDSLWGLYARDLASSTVRPIPGTAIAPRGLFFSPDGERIGFAAEGRIQTVRLSGGATERIADLPAGFIGGGTWTTDDRIVYAAGGTLYIVSARGGALQVLARPDSARGERELVAPHYVPGADAILHTVISRGATPPRIGIMWFGDKRRKDIAEGSSPAFVERGSVLVFVRTDGQLDALPFDPAKGDTTGPGRRLAEAVQLRSPVAAFGEYAVSPQGTIVRVPRGGAGRATTLDLVDKLGRRETVTLPVRSEHQHGATFSPDGRRLAVMIADVNNATHSLYVHDIAAGTAVRIGSSDERGVFAWTGSSDSLLVVSDGASLIAVPADRPFAGHAVSSLQGWNGVRVVSARGPWVMFSGTAPSGRSNDLAWFHRDSSAAIHTYAGEGYNEDYPVLSPDARWVAYTSDESGTPQVYLSGFPVAGRRLAVSVGGGISPRWSGDGRTLYYIAGTRYAAVDVSESEAGLELTTRRFIPQFGAAQVSRGWDVDPTRPRIAVGVGSVWAGDRLLVELNAAANAGR